MPHRKRKRRAAHAGAEHEAKRSRIRRLRAMLLLLAVVPLGGSIGCESGIVAAACGVPREVYLGLWAAIFGAILGLTIRLGLERRRFEQRSRPG